MPERSIADHIRDAVGSWPGVTAETYHHGMIFFHVGRREIGHLHGNKLADLPFPVRIRKQLVEAGRASLHYLHPKTGWVTYYIRSERDVEPIVNLFRFNYERPWLESEPGVIPGRTSSSRQPPPMTSSTTADSGTPSETGDS